MSCVQGDKSPRDKDFLFQNAIFEIFKMFKTIMKFTKVTCWINSKLGTTVWKVPKYGVFSGPYFLVFSPNTGKYGQIRTRKNSVFGHFSRSEQRHLHDTRDIFMLSHHYYAVINNVFITVELHILNSSWS